MKKNIINHIALIFMFSISAISCLASASWATTYYVSTSGSDSSNGNSTSTPYKTIGKSLTIVNPGDTVNIMAGTYNEALTLSRGGSKLARITIQNYNGASVTVNSGTARVIKLSGTLGYYTISGLTLISNYAVYVGNKDYSVDLGIGSAWWGYGAPTDNTPYVTDDSNGCNGFTIQNCTIYGSVGLIGHYNTIKNNTFEGSNRFTNGAQEIGIVNHHNTFTGNTFHNYVNRAIWSMGNIQYNVYSNNTIYNDSITSNHVGIDVDCVTQVCRYNTVENNILYGHNIAVQLENGFSSVVSGNIVYNSNTGLSAINYGAPDGAAVESRNVNTGNIFMNNVVYNTSKAAIEIMTSPGNLIYNNTLDKNTGRAIWLENLGTTFNSNNTSINNNIITNSNIGVAIDGGTTGTTETNNLFYGNSSNGPSGLNFVSNNPLFVGVANYNLQAGSAARDRGTTIASVIKDILGISRPQGAAYDIGAYEYTTTLVSTLSPPTNLRVQ